MVGVAVSIRTRSTGEFRRLRRLSRPAGLSFHPNYAVVAGEIAVLVLGLPHMAAVFPILNAAVLAIRTGD
jgi:hypothetical protein